jgi:enamine deaminase RidA (YjgF/YER057c/UK114 family)
VGEGLTETVVRNPASGIYAATPDYVHAVEVRNPQRILYLAGTMGLDEQGKPGATLHEQLDLVWKNIRTILASADMTVDNIVRVTSYLREASYVEANQNARVAALKGRAVPTTAIVVETLSPGWLIELEVIAVG